jgi:carbamoyltransferase
MSKILGINLSHNISICEITNGKINFFYDEGRCLRKKHALEYYDEILENNTLIELVSINQHVTKVDKLIYSSYGDNFDVKYVESIQKQLKNPDFIFLNQHHLYHALCGFYFSNFQESLVIVMDGGGIIPLKKYNNHREIESIYYVTKNNFKHFYSHLSNFFYFYHTHNLNDQKENKNVFIPSPVTINVDNVSFEISSKLSSGNKFDMLTNFLRIGNGGYDSGKTMGLAAYGNLLGDRPEDLARQLQKDTKKDTIKLIKRAIKFNNCKNIILSGGYALNCTNNYEYIKEFPDYNFFIDPIAHDGGTALGAALYLDRMLKN